MKPVIAGLVSTIIPVHNRPEMLREAVESVLAQDYPPIEVLLVDDGSTDATGQVADAMAAANPGVVFAQHVANGGPGAAREAGRQQAQGEFIQYLDSDDLLLPGKFRRQVEGLRSRPDCDVAYGWTRYRHADGRVEARPWKRSGERIEAMFPSFLEARWWDTPNPLYRRSLCDALGPWLDTRLEEDWEYDCRAGARGTRLCHVPDYLCEVRDHESARLCRANVLDPARMRDRARVHERIHAHAQRAGIGPESPEMRHFARALFLLARQCGAAGLGPEARALFELARRASTAERAAGLDFRVYRTLAALVGWSNAGRLTCRLDRLRH